MAGPLMNSDFIVPPSLNGLRALMAGGEAPPAPPEMSLEEVAAALDAKPQRARKPEYTRSRGPTIDPVSGSPNEYDTPPTYGTSYRDKLQSLLSDGVVRGDSNEAPVRVDSTVQRRKAGDPRGSSSGTIVFSHDGPKSGGSIFDNPRGRDYLTAMSLRQEAIARGENPDSLAPLPGLRGYALGTPAGQPVPGGKTDQYNQMKAAQRAAQMANEANAPNLIMAREQMRTMGPRGAVMARLLAANGKGGSMDPALLASIDPNMAEAALKQQDISGLNQFRQGQNAIGMKNSDTASFAAQAKAKYDERVAEIESAKANGLISAQQAANEIAKSKVEADLEASKDRNATLRDTTNSTNKTQLSIAVGQQGVARDLGMAQVEVDRLKANGLIDSAKADNIFRLKQLEQQAKLSGDQRSHEMAMAQLDAATKNLDRASREKLGIYSVDANRDVGMTQAKAQVDVAQTQSNTAQKISDNEIKAKTAIAQMENEVNRMKVAGLLDDQKAGRILQAQQMAMTAKLAGDENALKLALGKLNAETATLDANTRQKLGEINAKANILSQDEFTPTDQKLAMAGLSSGNPGSDTLRPQMSGEVRRVLSMLPEGASVKDAMVRLLALPNVLNDPQAKAEIVSQLGTDKLQSELSKLDPSGWGLMDRLGHIGADKQYPETIMLPGRVMRGAYKMFTGETFPDLETPDQTTSRKATIAAIKQLLGKQ